MPATRERGKRGSSIGTQQKGGGTAAAEVVIVAVSGSGSGVGIGEQP